MLELEYHMLLALTRIISLLFASEMNEMTLHLGLGIIRHVCICYKCSEYGSHVWWSEHNHVLTRPDMYSCLMS